MFLACVKTKDNQMNVMLNRVSCCLKFYLILPTGVYSRALCEVL